jgi:1-hydroxycarotenoid 3,4-desaturase
VTTTRAVIVGGGIGGLTCAVDLAAAGLDVTVLERAGRTGGKLRTAPSPAGPVESGPTVFTLPHVFASLFDDAGESLADHLALRPVEILARNVWPDGSVLDMPADPRAAEDAIGRFAGAAEALRYGEFRRAARRVYDVLEKPYLGGDGASITELVRTAGIRGLPGLVALRPFTSLWRALEGHFLDPRLRQLFARYAAYCGSSPFAAPATLMMAAHVEQMGVWRVDGGLSRVADEVAALAARCGATVRCDTNVTGIVVSSGRASGVRLANGEVVDADVVVYNGDVAALGSGRLGVDVATAADQVPRVARSLSAVTWSMAATTSGFELGRNTVFFSADYPAEFETLFRHRRLADRPTIYVCAQDRDDRGTLDTAPRPDIGERLLILVNAPADGDLRPLEAEEIARCQTATFASLNRFGLTTKPIASTTTTPADFAAMYPGSGGALYGRATHGWAAAFQRPGPKTSVPGLYLTGGSAHPGPGVPMAALSGRLAARTALKDLGSTPRSRPAGTRGGTSTA